jgi:hypothetical protein
VRLLHGEGANISAVAFAIGLATGVATEAEI